MEFVNLSEVIPYWDTIYSNAFLFALAVALVLPFVVILVGYAINMLGLTLAQLVGLFMDPWFVYFIINYLFFPGVMIHETAHALFALLTGAKVTEVALFKKDGNSLGHVSIQHRGGAVLVATQSIFISSAPMFVGAAVVYLCYRLITGGVLPYLWLKILVGYLGVAMFFHMTMSSQDIKVYVKGIPIFMLILFIVMLIMRFIGVF